MSVVRRKSFLPKIAMIVLAVLIFIYTAYHLANLFFVGKIETIISGVTVESDTVSGKGYIFRDETPLYSEKTGAVDYFVKNGEKVSKDQQLANVYGAKSAQDGENAKKMLLLTDKQIELLEKSVISDAEVTDTAILKSQASDIYFKLLGLLSENNTGELSVQIEKMIVTLNKLDMLINSGDKSDVKAELELLKKQRANDLKKAGEYVEQYTTESGYFYYATDGFESKFSTSALENITADKFYSLANQYDNGNAKISAKIFGKLAKSTRWNFAIPVSQAKAELLDENKEYKVTFKENNNTTLVMTLLEKIEANSRGETILIFECNKLPQNFSLERCQNAEIELSSVEGIYVPLSAMAREDGILGVYIARGSVVFFNKVDVIYRGYDYCLVAKNGDSEGGYDYLATNELIITNGKNMFHGRILE